MGVSRASHIQFSSRSILPDESEQQMPRSRKSPLPMGSAHVARMFEKYDFSGLVPGAPTALPEEVSASHQDVKWVSPECVLNGPFQHQEYIDPEEFGRLVEAIKNNGFHAALYVNIDPKQDGYYFLTAGGHQRRDAAKAAGVTKLPIFIEPPVERIILAFRALNENTIGVNRSPVNVGYLLLQIKEEYPDLTYEEIATRIGRSRGWINNRLIVAREAEDLQVMVARAGEDRGMRAMLALRKLTQEERAPVIAEFLAGGWTSDMVEGKARDILSRRDQSSTATKQVHRVGDGHVVEETRALADMPSFSVSEEAGSELTQAAPLLTTSAEITQEGMLEVQPPFAEPVPPDSNESLKQPEGKGRDLLAREAKLRDALSRLEVYQRLCGLEAPSEEEGENLLKVVALAEGLLARRERVMNS